MSADTTSTTTRLLAELSLDGKNSVESRQINETALELLIPELVNTIISTTIETKRVSERIAMGLDPNQSDGNDDGSSGDNGPITDGGWVDLPEDNELMEQVYVKLENVGFRVGKRLAERFAPMNRRLVDTLDVVKFVCKDVWVVLFNRQVDNLKTNHRGIYMLRDNKFKWFLRMSSNQGGAIAARKAQPYIWFPCGIIRGVLDSFGINSVVIAETVGLPQCTFQVKVVSNE